MLADVLTDLYASTEEGLSRMPSLDETAGSAAIGAMLMGGLGDTAEESQSSAASLLEQEGDVDASSVHAHAGMLMAARCVVRRAAPVISQLLSPQDYALIVTGHSLGAGSAALATLLLQAQMRRSTSDGIQSVIDQVASAVSDMWISGEAQERMERVKAGVNEMLSEVGTSPVEGSYLGGNDKENDKNGTAETDSAAKPQELQVTWSQRMPITCVCFAPPPVLDAKSALACASRGSGASSGRFFGDKLGKPLFEQDAPLVLSFVARDDIVSESLRVVR